MRPGSSNSQTPFAYGSMPRSSRRNTVTNPDRPMVAMNANASVTPPNWASTPDAAVTARRSSPPGFAVTRAYASTAPNTAPATAVTADSRMLRPNACRMYASRRVARLSSVKPPSSPANAPITTTRVGMIRKIVTYAKNGTTPSRLRTRATSADGLGPVGRQVLLGLVGLLLGLEDRGALGGRERAVRRLVDRPGLVHGVGPHRPRAALEPQVLALVGEEELLPQAGGRRVRRVLADGLHVVGADHGVRRDHGLPGRRLGRLRDVQVVPVDDHRGLPGLDGGRGRVHRQEVAGRLQFLEELHARGDVV